jgi:hypothetical protein
MDRKRLARCLDLVSAAVSTIDRGTPDRRSAIFHYALTHVLTIDPYEDFTKEESRNDYLEQSNAFITAVRGGIQAQINSTLPKLKAPLEFTWTMRSQTASVTP